MSYCFGAQTCVRGVSPKRDQGVCMLCSIVVGGDVSLKRDQ